MRETAIAPSNVAFIKYWGRKDEALRLPTNGSISMNLSGLKTRTTVEFDPSIEEDSVTIYSSSETLAESKSSGEIGSRQARTITGETKVIAHLDRIRNLAGISQKAKVVSEGNFPRSTGLSSSASGIAALTLAGTKALGLELSEKDLSILACQGSGSACRSIPDGFVEWLDGDTSQTSYAQSIFPSNYWDIVDVVCILSTKAKNVPTSIGQLSASTSPHFVERLAKMPERIEHMKEIVRDRDFVAFGSLIEEEAFEMHQIMETSVPPLFYMTEETKKMVKLVKGWRENGLPVYFTVNTGANIHLICEQHNSQQLTDLVSEIDMVQEHIINSPSDGAYVSDDHLF